MAPVLGSEGDARNRFETKLTESPGEHLPRTSERDREMVHKIGPHVMSTRATQRSLFFCLLYTSDAADE